MVDRLIAFGKELIRFAAIFLALCLFVWGVWLLAGLTPPGRQLQRIATPLWERGVAMVQWIAPSSSSGPTAAGATEEAPSTTALGLAQQAEADKIRRDQAQKALDARRVEAAARKELENQKINLILGNAQPGDSLVVGVFDRATKKPVTGQVRLFLRDESTTEEVVLKPGEAKVKPAVKGRSYTLWAQSLDSMAQSNVCTIEYQGPGAQHQDLWMGPDFGSGGPPTTP